ncbi:MAG TPA: ATP-grasp domain-containing protein, partial [Methanoregula sp.]|nr:ATP-grasp domain-containing protein [Methanoregula sp.]
MKLREYEAKNVIQEAGIPVPAGFLIKSADELTPHLSALGDAFVLKAQVDVGGRGKAGGILMAGKGDGTKLAKDLFCRQIKGLPVKEILAEKRLDIQHEYYLSITVDRSSKQPLVLFTEAGGVDIEITAKEHPEKIHKVIANPLMRDIPPFMLRELLGTAPKEIGPIISKLYRVFLEKDALLAEINPLVTTPQGVFAADAKLIVDDNALGRQGFTVNRD